MANENSLSGLPYQDRVLVKPDAAETKTSGGIIVPDTAKEKPQRGVVVAVGEGKISEHTGNVIPIRVKVGDSILYSKYGGTETTIDGVEYLMMRETDILFKFNQ